MALRDIFKKRLKAKSTDKVKPVETTTQSSPGSIVKEIKLEKSSEIVTQKVKKEMKIGEVWRILKEPHITEKATALSKKNEYVFKVYPEANKIRIKKAIEDLYGVKVIDVRIIKVPRKKRRLGRISGWRKGYKKAIVKIKEGQKIEVLPR